MRERYKDLVFELEQIELDMEVLNSTFEACCDGWLYAQGDDKTDNILLGISRDLEDLTKKTKSLMNKGFKELQNMK